MARVGLIIAGLVLIALLLFAAAWTLNLRDGRPFLWDAEKGELRVQTFARQPPARRFGVHIWQPRSAG